MAENREPEKGAGKDQFCFLTMRKKVNCVISSLIFEISDVDITNDSSSSSLNRLSKLFS